MLNPTSEEEKPQRHERAKTVSLCLCGSSDLFEEGIGILLMGFFEQLLQDQVFPVLGIVDRSLNVEILNLTRVPG